MNVHNKKTRNYQLIILAIIVLIGIRCVDPMSVELHRVDRVKISDSFILLHVDDLATPGVGGIDEVQDFVMLSNDGGETWQRINYMPPEWANLVEVASVRVSTVCTKYNHLICYRIDGHSRIEQSNDTGITWHSIWHYPKERGYFTERSWGWDEKSAGLPLDKNPLDLAILENGSDHTVYFAMGLQGLLVLTPDGNWKRQAILLAKPMPFRITSVDKIIGALKTELLILIIGGLICFLYYFIRYIVIQMICCSKIIRLWRFMSMVLLSVFIFAFVRVDNIPMSIWTQTFYSYGHNPFYPLSFLFFGPGHTLMIPLILSTIWFTVSFMIGVQNKVWSFVSIPAYMVYSLSLIIVGSLPLVLWCLAIIQVYSIALLTYLMLSVLMVVIPRPLLLSIPYRANGRIHL